MNETKNKTNWALFGRRNKPKRCVLSPAEEAFISTPTKQARKNLYEIRSTVYWRLWSTIPTCPQCIPHRHREAPSRSRRQQQRPMRTGSTRLSRQQCNGQRPSTAQTHSHDVRIHVEITCYFWRGVLRYQLLRGPSRAPLSKILQCTPATLLL